MGLTWALTLIATILVAGRTYVAVRQLERLGWDVVWALITYVRRSSHAAPEDSLIEYIAHLLSLPDHADGCGHLRNRQPYKVPHS